MVGYGYKTDRVVLDRAEAGARVNGMQLTHDDIVLMSPEERLSLIEQLWSSLDEADVPVTPAQQAELARRLAMLDRDRLEAVTWETLKAELTRRCP